MEGSQRADKMYVISRTTINNVSFVALVAPIACSSFSIRCDTDVVIVRTDPNDANTQDTIPLGSQEYVLGETFDKNPRWFGGDTILYLKAQTQGSAVIIAKFLGYK